MNQMNSSAIRELSTEEVEQVNGGIGLPGAAWGAGMGAISYLGTSIGSHRFSWRSFGMHVGLGASIGFFGGWPSSRLARYAVPRISFLGGLGISRLERIKWK